MNRRTAVVFVLLGVCFGCGGETATTKDGSSSATASGSAKKSTKASASAVTVASVAPSASAAPPKEAGPLRWTDFTGPKVPVDKTVKETWAVLPSSTSFTALKFAKSPVESAEDDALLVLGYEKVWVPGAFVHKVEEAKVAKGDPVLVKAYATAVHGRVVEAGDKIKTKVFWIDTGRDEEVGKADVIKLTGTALGFGEPIAYKENADWRYGTFIYKGGDKSWIMPWGGKSQEVANADIKNIAIGKQWKKGDDVWGPYAGILKPAKVVEVLDEGVSVKINMNGEDKVVSYAEVTSPM